MTKKNLLYAAAGVTALAVLAVPVLLALLAVVFGAAAQAAQNACISPVGTVAPAGGPVRLPVVGSFQVTSEFGMRVDPGSVTNGQYRMHKGIDLAELPGPGTVVAAMAGVVKATPSDPLGGNMIYFDHGGGLVTVFEHLASRSVSVGDTVAPGQPVGVEGATGNVSGPHLHFQVEVNGQPVNPRDWLTQQGITVPALGGTGTAPAAGGSSATPTAKLIPTPAPLNPVALPGQTKAVVPNLPAQVGPYKGDQVLNAAYIVKAGQALNLDAKSIAIGVMTGMGESSLLILDHGDSVGPDSRGLFQQRDNGAWGTYSDRMNPTISSTNFFKALMAVPNYLSLEPTIAAHLTQHNADPYHYTPFWADAVLMVSTLTADPALLQQLPAAGPVAGCSSPVSALPAGNGTGSAIVAAAQHYIGTEYSWGGGTTSGPSLGIYSSPSLDGSHTVGFDCSGLVLFAVFNATGIQLDHSAEAQGQDPRGVSIPRDWSQMQPGDVISFSENGSGAPGSFGHVGIYAGGGKMIDAPRPGKTVELIQLQGSSYYEPMAWSIRRYAKAP